MRQTSLCERVCAQRYVRTIVFFCKIIVMTSDRQTAFVRQTSWGCPPGATKNFEMKNILICFEFEWTSGRFRRSVAKCFDLVGSCRSRHCANFQKLCLHEALWIFYLDWFENQPSSSQRRTISNRVCLWQSAMNRTEQSAINHEPDNQQSTINWTISHSKSMPLFMMREQMCEGWGAWLTNISM